MHRSLLPSLLASFTALTASGCVEMADDVSEVADDTELGESSQELTAGKPLPACEGACTSESRTIFWDGHDSMPQIASDIGSGKVARDITYCLFKSAVGSNGQREIAARRIGAGAWYEQGVSTRMVLSSASPPSGAIQGGISGWHSVTLTSFGKKFDPDVQWFELHFPVEMKTQRPSGTWYYDASGRLVPHYYKPTGYYTDVNGSKFDGSKPLPGGVYPSPTVTLTTAQTLAYGGNNRLNPWPTWGDDSYPSWEAGYTSVFLGQTLSSTKPSTMLQARVPIVSSGVFTLDLFAEAQVRHYLQLAQGADPDLSSRGVISLEMASKTTFKIRVQGKLYFGWWDLDINQTLFNLPLQQEVRRLGSASFDRRSIYHHVDANGVTDNNPAGWLTSCLASAPSVSSEQPQSNPRTWADGIRNTVIGNAIGCPQTRTEFAIGALCDRSGRPIPTGP